MLISKRRLRWGTLCLLVVCAMILLQPTRAWIEALWIAQVLGPKVSVDAIVYHPSKSVVQARKLRWRELPLDNSPNVAQRSVGVSIDHSWLGYDLRSLAHGQLRLSKVILEDADLSLDGSLPRPSAQRIAWQARIAQHIGNLNWESLEHSLSYGAATDQLKQDWRKRIDDWLVRSQQILAQSTRFQDEVASLSNPLRVEQSLRDRLMLMQQLAAEHRALTKEIEQVPMALANDSSGLKQLYQQEVEKLRSGLTSCMEAPAQAAAREAIASDCILDIGQLAWRQLAPYAEVVDRLGGAFEGANVNSHNVTFRAPEYAGEWLRVAEWKAQGQFRAGALRASYHASGECGPLQVASGQAASPSLQATFDDSKNQIDVRVQYHSDGQHNVQLMLAPPHGLPEVTPVAGLGTHAEESPSDRLMHDSIADYISPKESTASQTSFVSQANLITRSGALEGRVTIAHAALQDLVEQLPESSAILARELLATGSASPLDFVVSGSWNHVELHLQQAIAAGVSSEIERETREQLLQAAAAKEAQLATDFERQLLAVRYLVESAANDLREQVTEDSQQLTSNQQSVQQRLDEMHGTEFARRPDTLQR